MFGGMNFKRKANEDTLETLNDEFCSHKPHADDAVINILNDLWVFEFKNQSWYRPIVGGKHPRRSFNFVIHQVPAEDMTKFVFISQAMKKNKVYDLCSSGK